MFKVGHPPSYIALAVIHRLSYWKDGNLSFVSLDELNKFVSDNYKLTDPDDPLGPFCKFRNEWMEEAAQILIDLEIATKASDPFAGDDYLIQKKLCTSFFELADSEDNKLLNQVADKGHKWLKRALQGIVNQQSNEFQHASEEKIAVAPAADRIVTINHNSAEYQDTEQALNNLFDAVRADNEFGDSEPLARDQVLAELKATQELIKSEQVAPNRIDALAGGTFVYLAEKFAEGPIGELATLAWTLLKALLGI